MRYDDLKAKNKNELTEEEKEELLFFKRRERLRKYGILGFIDRPFDEDMEMGFYYIMTDQELPEDLAERLLAEVKRLDEFFEEMERKRKSSNQSIDNI